MTDSRQPVLTKLDILLTDFLKSYAIKRLDYLQVKGQVNRLKVITFGEKKQYLNLDDRFEALELWFGKTGPKLSLEFFDEELIELVSLCLDRIGSYCRGEVDYDDGRPHIFDRRRAARVSLMARTFLNESCKYSGYEYTAMGFQKIKPYEEIDLEANNKLSEESNLKKRFIDYLKYQVEYIEYYRDSDENLLKIADNLLNNLEENPDTKSWHLTGSILNFLKTNGYRVDPYEERLGKLNGQKHE